MVQLPPAQGAHPDREDRGGLPGRAEADAAARGYLRRAARKAGQREDALSQDRQRQQSTPVHREQRSEARQHWSRGYKAVFLIYYNYNFCYYYYVRGKIHCYSIYLYFILFNFYSFYIYFYVWTYLHVYKLSVMLQTFYITWIAAGKAVGT